jgi:hypothetical protein
VQGLGNTTMTNRRVQHRNQEKYEIISLFVSLERFPFSLLFSGKISVFSSAGTGARLGEYSYDE